MEPKLVEGAACQTESGINWSHPCAQRSRCQFRSSVDWRVVSYWLGALELHEHSASAGFLKAFSIRDPWLSVWSHIWRFEWLPVINLYRVRRKRFLMKSGKSELIWPACIAPQPILVGRTRFIRTSQLACLDLRIISFLTPSA